MDTIAHPEASAPGLIFVGRDGAHSYALQIKYHFQPVI